MTHYMRAIPLLLLLGAAPLAAQVRAPRDTARVTRGLRPEVAREAVALYNGAALRARGRTEVDSGQTVAGDVAVLDGPVIIAGRVTGRVVALNSDVIIRPSGHVDGDLLVVGGEAEGLREGRVRGETRVYPDPLRYSEQGDRLAVAEEGEEDERGGHDFWRRWERIRARDRTGIHISSAGAYNRVEGLPVNIGGKVRQAFGDARLSLDAYAVLRTESSFQSDSSTMGYNARLELRPIRRGVAVGGRMYDVNAPVETWQVSDLEAGLAAFVARRDYRDYYARHGGSGFIALVDRYWGEVTLQYAHEQWNAVGSTAPWSLFYSGGSWRASPQLDEGRMHLATLSARLDTRNDPNDPRDGWLVLADLEHGRGRITQFGPTSPGVRATLTPGPEGALTRYTTAFLDVRRYGRISPHGQINVRGVLAGWVAGDELPLERRLSVDGPGSIPGSGFRRERGLAATACISEPTASPGLPAQCERIALGQVEFRGDLQREVNLFGFRPPGITEWVAFLDGGRGWLVRDDASGSTGYGRGAIPPLSTFRADVGLGLDVGGVVGLYVAKAVSHGEPPVAFLRLRRRF